MEGKREPGCWLERKKELSFARTHLSKIRLLYSILFPKAPVPLVLGDNDSLGNQFCLTSTGTSRPGRANR